MTPPDAPKIRHKAAKSVIIDLKKKNSPPDDL